MKLNRNNHTSVRLNIASGHYVLPGYINYDNNPSLLMVPFRSFLKYFLSKRRIKAIDDFYEAKKKATLKYRNCIKPLNFPDASINEVYCSHFLEHVYPTEAKAIVNDFYRVLKIGGKLEVVVPDLETLIRQYVESDSNDKRADLFIEKTILTRKSRPSLRQVLVKYFKFSAEHHWLYDGDSMAAFLKECGFCNVGHQKQPEESVRITAIK